MTAAVRRHRTQALASGEHGRDQVLPVREAREDHPGDVQKSQREREIGKHLVGFHQRALGFASGAGPRLRHASRSLERPPRRVIEVLRVRLQGTDDLHGTLPPARLIYAFHQVRSGDDIREDHMELSIGLGR